ncbi:MAG: secretin N-terminal domain-containing protein [Cyanobacteriota bacterium]|nr:secretin N-terminal domain-containing protein [Cyanobacteriota bacterium]
MVRPVGRGFGKRLLAASAASSLAALAIAPWDGTAAPNASNTGAAAATPTAATKSAGSLQLKVRRLSDAIELVIEGTGAGPQLVQSTSSSGWQGQLTTSTPNGLRLGPQRLSIPEAGLQLVSLSGSGSSYQIDVAPTAGLPLSRPVVSADGQSMILTFPAAPQASLRTLRPNLNQPGAIPQPAYAPPLQPRASAPPVGDMAVGTMTLQNFDYVRVNGPAVTLTLRNAPAKDALMALAQLGGYGFVYVGEPHEKNIRDWKETSLPESIAMIRDGKRDQEGKITKDGAFFSQISYDPRPVTISFRNEPYSSAINAVLLAAGWQGRMNGRLLIAGPNAHGKAIGPRVSKVYRLNQSSASSAADYLASLGASITKIAVITNTTTAGVTEAAQIQGGKTVAQQQVENITTAETYGASLGPLKGLQGTTDSRLQTITLVGDPSLVAIAENYLRQIDLRQRQVALAVKILDVTLGNDATTSNSFAFRFGNNFIVNDEGQMLGAFGGNLPPRGSQFETISGGASSAKQTLGDPTNNALLPNAPAAPVNPAAAYNPNNFYDFVRATVESQSTKVLASPTLILSENPEGILGGTSDSSADPSKFGANAAIGRSRANESFVTVGENVISSYAVTAGQNGAPNSCQPVFSIAGLTFGARINKIDDNGFVTFSLSPAISASTRTQQVQNCGLIDILAIRRLDTGTVRVRDGQTLILTGVISDSDVQAIRKWPILGDIPFIGQFFRSSAGSRDKRELVIMVTPRIINDELGGSYGYGYQPSSRQSREFMGQSSGM